MPRGSEAKDCVARARRWLALSSLCLSVGVAGCGAALHSSGEHAAQGVVEGTVEGVQAPETQRALADVLSDPGIEAGVRSLSAAAAAGVVEGFSDVERAAHLRAGLEGLVSHLTAALSRDLRRELQPAIAETVAKSVELSIERALGPEARGNAEAMAAAVARGALRGIDEGMNDADFGSLSGATRALSRDATLGFQDAVTASASHRAATGDERGNVLAAVGEAADATLTLAPWVLLALVLASVALALWLVLRARRRRRQRCAEDRATEAALASALHALESGEEASEVRARMERAVAGETPDAALMKRVLHRWSESTTKHASTR